MIRESEFERLYSEHAQALFRFLMYRTGDWSLSEDLLEDMFEKVLRSRRPWPLRSDEKPWLYTIALNCVRDSARRSKVEQRALERVAAEPASEQEAESRITFEEREEVQHALKALSEEEREAIALRFGADLTVRDVAAALQISLTTAEGRVYRALRKLRELLS